MNRLKGNSPILRIAFFLQRELPHVDWDCALGKLDVSIFPRLNPLDGNNLCFTDPKARVILLLRVNDITHVFSSCVIHSRIGFDI